MSRSVVTALSLLALSLLARPAAATDIKGTVSAIDVEKRTISIKADEEVKSFDVDKDAKVFQLYGSGKRTGFSETAGGLKDVSVNSLVIASTETQDGKEFVARIKIESSAGRTPRKAVTLSNPAPAADKNSSTTDVKGTVTALDARKLQMTLTVDGKPKVFTVTKTTNVLVQVKGSDKKKPRYDVAEKGLAEITVGADLTVTVDSSSGKDLVTMVKINTPSMPPKK